MPALFQSLPLLQYLAGSDRPLRRTGCQADAGRSSSGGRRMLLLQTLLQPLSLYAAAPIRARLSSSDDSVEEAPGRGARRALAGLAADQNGSHRKAGKPDRAADKLAPQQSIRAPGC